MARRVDSRASDAGARQSGPARLANRSLLWAAGALALVLVAAGLAPWTVSQDALREEIAGQLRSSAGVYVFTRGAASVSMLPRPRVRFENVALVDANGALVVESEALTGNVRLLPLIAGRLELAEVTLRSPQITIDIDRAPFSSAGAAVRAAAAPAGTPQSDKADAARLGVLTLSNGHIVVRRDGVQIASATRVEARLDWRTVGSPAALAADLDWRGRRQQFVLWVAQPAAMLRGGATPMTAQVKSPDTTIMSAGTADFANKPRFEGRIQVATNSTSDLLASLGLDLPLPTAIATLSFDGLLSATPTLATIRNLRLDTGEEAFEGTLGLQTGVDQRPLLSGTLATRSLSIEPYLSTTASVVGPDGKFSSEPFAAIMRGAPDLDLRLSAGRLRYGQLQAKDAAVSILAKENRLEVAIADAAAYGGAIKGRAVLAGGKTTSTEHPDLQATVAMRGIDWAAFERDVGGQGRITGTADFTASLQGRGDNPLQAIRSLAGQSRLSLTNGDLGGLDVAGTLARLEKRPLAAATDLGSGRTRFDRAVLPFEIGNGVVTLRGGEIVAPDFAITVDGDAQLAEGQTRMTASVRPAAAAAEDGAAFAFDVSGPWNRLNFTPDIPSLIRRSGAASPLFGPSEATPAAIGAR